ncbi:MAG: hypothetical protein KC493_00440 [Bacteriovoracaceae bacterium]|nr:hypothetical protein [Bacteriovoracaceae bacterium]
MPFETKYFGKDKLDSKWFEREFLSSKLEAFNNIINDSQYGFFHITKNESLISSCEKIFDQFSDKKTFVQVGIGGSSLGPEMLHSSLGNGERNFIFLNNIDPDRTWNQLKNIDLDSTLFYFVSKSGGTAETMSGLAIVAHLLEEKNIPKSEWNKYMVFATDPKNSQLLDLGNELNIKCLEIPSNVGGRFSVLTPVGFLPAIFDGIDIKLLVRGAEVIKEDLLNSDLDKNLLLQSASFIYGLYKEHNIHQTVFMPYSSMLRDLSFWFVQLWAESLGKRNNLNGEVVNTGLTPIPAYGATDQHSQVQLFMEGPFDKLALIIEVDQFAHDFSLNNSFEQKSLKRLAPFSLGQLMKAEHQGTLKALEQNNRAYLNIKISKCNEINIGGLIMYFESLTALMGHYFNINPFDQPGVEAGKQFAYEWLDGANKA